ncbi:hypothetical protein SAPIO_CDS2368 [Scedosporium apiospermum]|uniref:glutathione transferase n=1 Tax=Pseudallescheria apiosperma TaxID=563466 RepID=A0A084GCC0_PSEDA|nr:uncharacterized protein SAPIO_CDS2368 [Scedosporium apiospermum]KEZ44982.1 hypothetical protein SAPIO_CDS2368 [Scedosporium apiospermum]
MAIKVYGSMLSTCTQRVVSVLIELGLDYELSEVNMQKGEQKAPDYIKDFHPFGRIPVLDDGEIRLFESRAICQYLVAKYGKQHGLDAARHGSAAEIGTYEQAASVEFSYFDPSISGLAYENIFKKFMRRGDADADAVAAHRATLSDTLDHYERVLATRQYLASNDFSLIDLYHLPWIPFLSKLGLEGEISSRPNLEAWWKRASSRPSWQQLNK